MTVWQEERDLWLTLLFEDFGHPSGGYQGILASSLPLGSCVGLPFIPYINDRFGRRKCIMFGSILMIIGSLIQAFAINGMSSLQTRTKEEGLFTKSQV
jgi:MFS family permease